VYNEKSRPTASVADVKTHAPRRRFDLAPEQRRHRQRRRLQLKTVGRHVDPADPIAAFFRTVRNGVLPIAPARDLVGGFLRAPGDHRQLLAAFGEVPHFRGKAIERRRQAIEGVDETFARQRGVAREFPGSVAGGKAQLLHGGEKFGGRIRKLRDVARGRPRDDLRIARELDQLPAADLLAEEQRRRIGKLVRFVEDHRVAVRQKLGNAFVAQHHVGEEQVMVDHDDVGLQRFAPRLEHEAIGVVRAVLAQAVVAGGRDQGPDRRILRHIGQLGAIAALCRARKRDDLLQVPRVVAGRQPVLVRRSLQMVMTDVVGAALQQRDGHGNLQCVPHQRQIALVQLVLQRLGAGGYDDLAAIQQRRDEIGKRLAGSRAGFGYQLPAHGDGARDGLRHLELLRPEMKSRQFARERSAFAEDGGERGIASRRWERHWRPVRGQIRGRCVWRSGWRVV
jgi:hypothetical protein